MPRVLGERPRDWGDDRSIDLAAYGGAPPSTGHDLRGCQLAALEAVGRPIGAYDLLIAGQARRRGARLDVLPAVRPQPPAARTLTVSAMTNAMATSPRIVHAWTRSRCRNPASSSGSANTRAGRAATRR